MSLITATSETHQLIAKVAELRDPEETTLLLSSNPQGELQAHLVDRQQVETYVDGFCGQITKEVKVFITGVDAKRLVGNQLSLSIERTKPNFCSDSVALESQLGYRILCTLETNRVITQSAKK